MRRRKARRTDWADDLSALAQLYMHDDDIKTFVDMGAQNPSRVWTWGNKAFPLKVMAAAGSFAELLVEPDRISFRGDRRFEKVAYTYYPAQFLLDFHEELIQGAKWAEAGGKE